MQNLLQGMMGGRGMGGGGAQAQDPNEQRRDTSETVHISSLALLKMLIHCRAGIPLEVMGLMIGQYIDEYTVRVVDVFSMPQTATGQSVEAVDPEYQANMLERLEMVGRPEKVVGWYHSHPGFGCWLSGEDVQTAQGYEQLTKRSVSVVLDPIQSVRGNVVIDAFRTIDQQQMMISREDPRQTTSNVGFMQRPNMQALVRGLGRSFYSMPVAYRKQASEIHMLLNVHKKSWRDGLKIDTATEHERARNESIATIKNLAQQAERFITTGKDEDLVGNVGKINPATHLMSESETLISNNLDHSIGMGINALVF